MIKNKDHTRYMKISQELITHKTLGFTKLQKGISEWRESRERERAVFVRERESIKENLIKMKSNQFHLLSLPCIYPYHPSQH